MTRKISGLSSKEVLALAIHVERSNGRRLRRFADAFDGYDDAVAKQFRDLAEEEDRHEAWLAEKFKMMFKGPVPAVGEFDVEEVVEAVEWDDSEHQIFDSLKAGNVFKLALQAEENAREFYRKAETAVKDKALSRLFHELAEMENGHMEWLEKGIKDTDRKGRKNGGKS